MFERFTDRARKVMALANQEAQRFNHEYVGTEHMLLGLVEEGSGVGANVLRNLDVDLAKVRQEVEKLTRPGPDKVTKGKLPQTPKAKRVVEYAIEESRNLGHNYVGTEHLLLGLLREQDGVAAQVLINLGLKLEAVREEILNLLGAGGAAADAMAAAIRTAVVGTGPYGERWVVGLCKSLIEALSQEKLRAIERADYRSAEEVGEDEEAVQGVLGRITKRLGAEAEGSS